MACEECQAVVTVLRLQIYQDSVLDLLGGVQLTQQAANQDGGRWE